MKQKYRTSSSDYFVLFKDILNLYRAIVQPKQIVRKNEVKMFTER